MSEFDIDQKKLREKLKEDSRVELLFSSPSGDGLKVLFQTDKKIDDSSYYALFYKSFCVAFNKEYQLGAALDLKTNDVTRCCFVSYDPKTYYNPEPQKIDPENYLSPAGFHDFDEVQKSIKEEETEYKKAARKRSVETPIKTLPDEVLIKIKERLGKRVRRAPAKKEYIQPGELQSLVKEIEPVIKDMGAELTQTRPISYGRVLHIKAGKYWAEINLFYGKKGTTVVRTSKTGSNKDLANMMYEFLTDYFKDR